MDFLLPTIGVSNYKYLSGNNSIILLAFSYTPETLHTPTIPFANYNLNLLKPPSLHFGRHFTNSLFNLSIICYIFLSPSYSQLFLVFVHYETFTLPLHPSIWLTWPSNNSLLSFHVKVHLLPFLHLSLGSSLLSHTNFTFQAESKELTPRYTHLPPTQAHTSTNANAHTL